MQIFKLEQTRALQILMYLHKNQEVIIKNLLDDVGGSYATIDRAMNALKELKLIEDFFKVGRPSKRFVKITEKGHRAALIVLELEESLNND